MCGPTKRLSSPSEDAPWLLQKWQNLYNAVPKMCIPFTNYDMGFSVVSAVVIIIVRTIAQHAFIAYGWPEENAMTASGSVGSIFHSMNLVPALMVILWTRPKDFILPSSKMGGPQWWQDSTNAVLSFCIGYMIADSIVTYGVNNWVPGVGVVLKDGDEMYLAHHFMTAFYMISCRVIGAGHNSAMICMFMGEATNPFHNMLYITTEAMKLDCCNGPMVQALHHKNEFVFSLLYCMFRTFLSFPWCLHITYDILIAKGRKNIPIVLRFIFTIMIWGVYFGSVPWIKEAWRVVKMNMGMETQEL
mmetsp:Transcript_16168/g.22776  ORF Transcript_16168/g.22776 Transcript_16168/m.22776 type:complete len:302 (-) Transcript_16168:83-988(-)